MFKIKVLPKAKADISNTMNWYKKEGGKELALNFKEHIFTVVENLQNDIVEHGKVKFGLSRIFVKKFPYVIYFIVADNTITIFAVLHKKQNTDKLLKRL
jgi:plasmid stabilization system protein ParE